MQHTPETVFVIDRDPAVRNSLEHLLRQAGLLAMTFRSQEEFLDQYQSSENGCVICDLPDSAPDALDRLHSVCELMPIIVMSDHADIHTAVTAMKRGVLDFLQKPVNPAHLLSAINEALTTVRGRLERDAGLANIADRFREITAREREILDLLVSGNSNKQIALQLGISLKTVQHHRANLMSKTNALNVADLVRLTVRLSAA